MTIGLVAGSLADPALAMFAVGAEREARRQGHSVLVGNLSDDGDNGVEVVRSLIERRVDGIVAAAPQLEEDMMSPSSWCAMSLPSASTTYQAVACH